MVGNAEYEKKHFFLIDFCAVAEFFEEKYDYAAPIKISFPTTNSTSNSICSDRYFI